MSTKFSKALAGVALLALWICTTSSARANLLDLVGQQILTIDGTIGRFDLSYSGTDAIFKLSIGAVAHLDNEEVDLPVTFTDMVLNSAATVVPGGKAYTFSTTGNPITQTITGLPLGMGFTGSATFLLTGDYAFVPDDLANTIALTGTIKLDSYTSDIKFDGFGINPSTFTFTLNTATGSFSTAISAGITKKGSGSFSEIDPPSVPEPASVVLLVSAVITGLCYSRRRLRRPTI